MIEFQLDETSGVATYLQLAQQVHQALRMGMLEPGDQLPTAQQVVAQLAINPNTVLGQRPAAGPAQLARVGFVAQDTAVCSRMTVADHLRLGAWLNPGWDDDLARQRTGQLALDPKQRAGSLSGGQRAQLALTLAMAKRPELLILDEPRRPRPAGPAGVPAGPDGGGRRAAPQRRA